MLRIDYEFGAVPLKVNTNYGMSEIPIPLNWKWENGSMEAYTFRIWDFRDGSMRLFETAKDHSKLLKLMKEIGQQKVSE